VGRAAVSNWRRRYPDFPSPVAGSAASPRYALTDVQAWLARHGRSFHLSPADRVWQQVRGAVDDLRLGDLIGQVGAFLVFHRRRPGVWRSLSRRPDEAVAAALAERLPEVVPELPGEPAPPDPAAVATLREAAAAAGEQHHREVFDLLCERFLELHARRRRVVPAPVAELIVDLADAGHGDVLDPACGVGTLLVAARARRAQRLLGQESDPTAARLAAARLLLRDAPVRLHTGDSLRADAYAGEQVDAVVCDPPFHERSWGYDELVSDPRWEYGLPPRGEPELAWVQHCLSHLRPGGRLAITMPAGVASRRAGRRIRGNLLRHGALRAVVSLPGTGPGATAPDLWVLRRPAPGDPAASHLLVVDATGDPAVAAQAWRAFDGDPEAALPGRALAVRIIDLLDDEVDLSPARHLSQPPADAGADFARTRVDLASLLDRLATGLPELATSAEPAGTGVSTSGGAATGMVSLGELIRTGAVTLHQAPLRMTTEDGDIPVLTAKDLRRHRGPSGRTADATGTVKLAPGDVVTSMALREPTTVVITDDTTADAVLGPQLHLLRVDPQKLDPYFLAGFLRIGQARVTGRGSSLGTRSDLHRVTLPRLPLAEQRRYGAAFRALIDFEEGIHRTTALADRLLQEGLAGLAAGTLRPADDG